MLKKRYFIAWETTLNNVRVEKGHCVVVFNHKQWFLNSSQLVELTNSTLLAKIQETQKCDNLLFTAFNKL